MVQISRVLNFRSTVPALKKIVDRQTATIAGTITNILFHFPTGCNSLVLVRVLCNGASVFPKDGYIALDGSTAPYDMSWQVEINDLIDVEISNTDSLNAHTITATVTITGEDVI